MLDESLLKYRDELANEKTLWPEYQIVRSIAGEIYSLSANYKPSGVDAMISHLISEFRKSEHVKPIAPGTYAFEGSLNSLGMELKKIILNSEDFMKLNIPDEHGDFIDLDALLQNFWYDLNVELLVDRLFESSIEFILEEEH